MSGPTAPPTWRGIARACSSAALAAALAVAAACGDGDEVPLANPGVPTDPSQVRCGTPEVGCPCSTPGTEVDCGKVERRAGDYVACSVGKRACQASGTWGACVGDQIRFQFAGGPGLLNLADGGSPCGSANPCDPYCYVQSDTPQGLDVQDSGLEVTEAGLALEPSGELSLGLCSGLVLTPTARTLTVTQLAPVSPSTATFTASLVPAGCYPVAISPLFTINDAARDRAFVTGVGDQGTVTLVSPVAGPLTVNAYIGGFSASATVDVRVDVLDTSDAPPGTASSFPAATGGADTLEVLYPYDDTVFPLGLPAPIPQWRSASAASAVKVTLRYGTAFSWAAIVPENAPLTIVPTTPPVTLPADKRFPDVPDAAWKAFERSARGQPAQVVLQRIVGGTRRAEVVTPIRFAKGQLKGTVYYQSYGTQLVRNFSGGAQDSTGGRVFPSGYFGGATLAIRPGAAAPTVVAGQTPGGAADGSGTYCRVCHKASADGSMLITQKTANSNTVSQVYTNLASSTPTYVDMPGNLNPNDGRYAWPAFYPDASFLFSNAGVMRSYTSGPAPGGLDGTDNGANTSRLYSLLLANRGQTVASTYRTSGGRTITLGSSSWGLDAALPVFAPLGDQIAFQHHDGVVCAGSTAQCNTAENRVGDKRSIGIMNFDNATKRFTNFRLLVDQASTPCNTTFNAVTPCTNVWPTFTPRGEGVVFEKEVHHNGDIGGGLSDFAGTRSGCDNSGLCNNDGVKGELWWVNTTGSPAPARLNRANGRTAAGANDLPLGADSSFCRVGTMACTSNAQCCSNHCSGGRCAGVKRYRGNSCGSGGECVNGTCSGGACSTGTTFTPQNQAYVPGHNATVEPVLNYEPTFAPKPTVDENGNPEFYWVLFTSRRMFGNIATVNPWWSDPRRQNISQTVTPKKLWVAAVSANPTAGTDPSYPAFYMPGQEWISGNSLGFWVDEACKPANASRPASSECDSNLDCCGAAAGTAICSLQTPVANPPRRHCVPKTACQPVAGACSNDSDCCAGTFCSGGVCRLPPPLPTYSERVFVRDFNASCDIGSSPVWRFFDWQAHLPADTSIVFSAVTADAQAGLAAAAPSVGIGTATAPSTTGWTSGPATVDQALRTSGQRSRAWLRVTMRLRPSTNTFYTPTLTAWRQNYNCTPTE